VQPILAGVQRVPEHEAVLAPAPVRFEQKASLGAALDVVNPPHLDAVRGFLAKHWPRQVEARIRPQLIEQSLKAGDVRVKIALEGLLLKAAEQGSPASVRTRRRSLLGAASPPLRAPKTSSNASLQPMSLPYAAARSSGADEPGSRASTFCEACTTLMGRRNRLR